MADIRFEEIVVLGCEFEMWPSPPPDSEADLELGEQSVEVVPAEDEDRFDTEYPSENIIRWKSTASRDGDRMLLLLWARIEAPRLPFRLTFDIAARYITTDEELTAERARPTLIWLAYPFFRELVYNITGRSPLEPYALPPLTRLPDPDEFDQPPGA
jgi:hypothetical protein